MSLSRETIDKIRKFAKEQSRYYLEDAEMTYMEKMRRKSAQTRDRIMKKLAKFKNRSETALEAQNDMILYMSDYMNDLIAQGYSEQEAFERARQDLQFRSDSDKSADLKERFTEYYENFDPAASEAIGLFYAGFLFFGVAIGGLAGLIAGGGKDAFLSGGWIDTLVGVLVGGVIGLGFGMISNAVVALKNRQ
ncbi:Putative uncharacterized protein [Thermobacillus xylanilyticus]|uniref:Glycine zipper family protein n=1 Tax=Thermobacillus xylanilyticus TaxID=76633 RepID=A0ABN7RTD9_THEXY|nr:hypothetical protein [Thermobacillus xylanilyticus]CAG5083025.1 Putative uncharacterized protein [Thermobacillus xylanilyticus]